MEPKGTVSLKFIWKFRLKLWAEGLKLYEESDKLWTGGAKLYAESNKLWAEGLKLREEGDKLWVESILEAYGNIKSEWKNYNAKYKDYECHLENGEVFGFDEE